MENYQIVWILLGLILGAGGVVLFLKSKGPRKSGHASADAPARDSSQVTADVGMGAPPTEPEKSAELPVAAVESDEARVVRGLSRTKVFFQQTFDRLFTGSKSNEFFGDLEEALLSADIGLEFSERIVAELRSAFGLTLPGRTELRDKLREILLSKLPDSVELREASVTGPRVIMIVGVNGAGKTTTIGKLCQKLVTEKKKVLVGAADTFRAAAVEQLRTWVDRSGADGVFQKEGSDPSAVAFDTVSAAVSRQSDVCIVDTAGRLHTKQNLMAELAKMRRVIAKALPTAPHDVWLVVDGSTGQNALSQAREFQSHLGLTGVIVTKLDGSAKGGAVLAIASELSLPIRFVGVGESVDDLVAFDGPRFVDAILSGL